MFPHFPDDDTWYRYEAVYDSIAFHGLCAHVEYKVRRDCHPHSCYCEEICGAGGSPPDDSNVRLPECRPGHSCVAGEGPSDVHSLTAMCCKDTFHGDCECDP